MKSYIVYLLTLCSTQNITGKRLLNGLFTVYLLIAFRVFFFDFQKNVNFKLGRFTIFIDVLDDFNGDRLTVAATTKLSLHVNHRYVIRDVMTFISICLTYRMIKIDKLSKALTVVNLTV